MRKKQLPKTEVQEKNTRYAQEILSNIGGENSEMSAIALYFYDQLVMREYPHIAAAFHKISIVEMQHLNLFGNLALSLGADPRLWELSGRRRQYWSPGKLKYAVKPRKVLMNALFSEYMAVEKYTRQAKTISDPAVTDLLSQVIAEEKEHIRIYNALLDQV